MARSLVTRRTDTLALVLTEPDTQVFSDPFFASIVRGVSSALASTELNLVLLTARDAREQEKVGRYVRQGHVDGVILMSLHGEDLLPGRPGAGPGAAGAVRPAARRAVRWRTSTPTTSAAPGRPASTCCGLGRTCIGTVTGPADMVAGVDRRTGFEQALAAAGVPLRPELVEEGDFSVDGGARATAALLARVPELDGLFVALRPDGRRRAARPAGRRAPGARGRRGRRVRRRRGARTSGRS